MCSNPYRRNELASAASLIGLGEASGLSVRLGDTGSRLSHGDTGSMFVDMGLLKILIIDPFAQKGRGPAAA